MAMCVKKGCSSLLKQTILRDECESQKLQFNTTAISYTEEHKGFFHLSHEIKVFSVTGMNWSFSVYTHSERHALNHHSERHMTLSLVYNTSKINLS